jgi:hypothetical protein
MRPHVQPGVQPEGISLLLMRCEICEKPYNLLGALARSRTGMSNRSTDFKSVASTDSATRA